MRKEIIARMKSFFGSEQEYVDHALEVLKFAEQLMGTEESSFNREIVVYAAVLHDVGIPEALRKHGSAAGPYQEKEGARIARQLLEDLRVPEEIIEEVCGIIGHHHTPGVLHTQNFQLLYDADWLVNFPKAYDINANPASIRAAIDSVFLTQQGKTAASKLFIGANLEGSSSK